MAPGDDPLDELLLRWEEARARGPAPSPEELCADRPELLDELRRRIRAVVEMEGILGVRERTPHPTLPARDEVPAAASVALPAIPGYRLVRVVGQGGMGVVYEAVQLDLGRTVAVKMISGPRLGPRQLARFRAEAEATARLQHPNVLQIFEVGSVEGHPYYSMEYVEGGNLAQVIEKDRPTPRRAAELVETLARAVEAAHARGIVHRDLKPANVLLTDDGIPKVADFGLAKYLDAGSGHTQTGEILGTPSYMSPEQAEGKKDVGVPSDVYALGAILYELLTGQPPFAGDAPLDTLRQVVGQDPIAPTVHNAAVPADLEAICLKCLEKAPSRRYATARELADDLRRFLDGRPVVARRIGLLRRAGKWVRRHPAETAVVAVVLVLACLPLLSLAGDYYSRRQLESRAEQAAPLAREILSRHCLDCHDGGALTRGTKTYRNFHTLEHAALVETGRRIVVPGAPDDSRLITRIADGSMPPEDEEVHRPRLTETELAILREWIHGGAPPFPPEDPNNPTPPVVPYSELAARVRTLFVARCYDCHKYDDAQGGIRILHHRLLVSVRKVVVPGRPEDSELFQLLTSPDEDRRMPPQPEARLSPEEIALVRRWIAEGAPAFPKEE